MSLVFKYLTCIICMISLVYLGILAFAVPIQKYCAKKIYLLTFVLISWFLCSISGTKKF